MASLKKQYLIHASDTFSRSYPPFGSGLDQDTLIFRQVNKLQEPLPHRIGSGFFVYAGDFRKDSALFALLEQTARPSISEHTGKSC